LMVIIDVYMIARELCTSCYTDAIAIMTRLHLQGVLVTNNVLEISQV